MKSSTWIIFSLVTLLMLVAIWRNDFSGQGLRDWQKCKESLFEQVVFNNCTLIFEGDEQPA